MDIAEEQNKAMDKKDIKLCDIYLVEGYIRQIFTEPYNTNVCQDILDLVLCFYAKPITMKIQYSDQEATVLYYPLHDTWHSIAHKIKAQFVCNSRVLFLEQEDGIRYNKDNWQSCEWSEQQVFKIKLAPKGSCIDVMENQIEVLISKAARERSLLLCVKSEIVTQTMPSGFLETIEKLPDRGLNRIFSNVPSELVDEKSILPLLTLVVMVYRVKISTATSHTYGPMLKGCVEHLAAWVIRNFGEKTDQKEHISVLDDAGNTVQGDYNVYTLKVQKNTFLQDFKMWVNKYIEMDGD